MTTCRVLSTAALLFVCGACGRGNGAGSGGGASELKIASVTGVSGFYRQGAAVDVDVHLTRDVTATGGSSTLSLTGERIARFSSQPDADTLRYRYEVRDDDNAADLTAVSFEIHEDVIETADGRAFAETAIPEGQNLADLSDITLDTQVPAPTVSAGTTGYVGNAAVSDFDLASGACSSADGDVTVLYVRSGIEVTEEAPCKSDQWRSKGVDLQGFSDGTVAISAKQTDAAGNVGLATLEVVKDTQSPDVTIASFASRKINDANASTFALATGTCTAGDDDVRIDYGAPGEEAVTETRPCAEGSWTSAGVDLSAFPDGIIAVTVRQSDAARNVTEVESNATKDTVPPTVAIAPGATRYVNGLNEGSYQLASGSCTVTEGPVTVRYRAAPATDVSEVVACVTGSWTSAGVDLSDFPDALVDIVVEQLDAAGNVGSASTSSLKDTVAPIVLAGADFSGFVATAPGATASDPGGSGVQSYAWTKSSGPGSVTFAPNDEVLNPTVAGDTEGPVTLTLTATDTAGNSAVDTVEYYWMIADTLTSTSDVKRLATARQIIFDDATANHWVFYRDGAALRTAYSPDNIHWFASDSVAVATDRFSVAHKAVGGAGYVFLVAEEAAFDVTIRRGAIGKHGITFEAPATVFNGSGATARYVRPSIALDDANIWVAASYGDGHSWKAQVRESVESFAGNLTNWAAPATLGPTTSSAKEMALVPRGGPDMYVVVRDESTALSYAYTGGSWASTDGDGTHDWLTIDAARFDYPSVLALADSELIVGGTFSSVGGNRAATFIARWDGAGWHSLGGGLKDANPSVLTVSGGDLYVGGAILGANGAPGNNIARWDGARWHALGDGLNGFVYAILPTDSGVYVGGDFTDAGGVAEADFLARWDGSAWHAIGGGLNAVVLALTRSGTDLYVGGGFINAGGNDDADHVARWDGSAWQSLGSGADGWVRDIVVSESNVYIVGDFSTPAACVGVWDGTLWHSLGAGLNSSAYVAEIVDDDLLVSGSFTDAGGNGAADYIARWDGAAWQPLGSGLNNSASSIVVSGADVYVSGMFTAAGGVAGTSGLARWDGSSWHSLDNATSGSYTAVAGSTDGVYVGGDFTSAGGEPAASRIAFWDGEAWNALDGGLNGDVKDIAVASGSSVYVGGAFTNAGGNASADGVARWDGASWQALGTGVAGIAQALAISGANLFVGGTFHNVSGIAEADRIARWNGTTWSALGDGLNDQVHAIVIDGSDVYVGGDFTDAGGDPLADRIARWDGTDWHAVGAGMASTVRAIAVLGTDVYVGGDFTNTGDGTPIRYVARWNGSSWVSIGDLSASVYSLRTVDTDVYVGGVFADAGGIAGADFAARWDGAAWHALGSAVSLVQDFDVWGDDVVAVTPKTLAVLRPVVAGAVTNLSVANDVDGDGLLLAYTTHSESVAAKILDDDTWSSPVTLASGAGDTAVASYDAVSGDYFAIWQEGEDLRFNRFDGSIWQPASSTFADAAGRYPVCDVASAGGSIACLRTSGAAAPYQIRMDYVTP